MANFLEKLRKLTHVDQWSEHGATLKLSMTSEQVDSLDWPVCESVRLVHDTLSKDESLRVSVFEMLDLSQDLVVVSPCGDRSFDLSHFNGGDRCQRRLFQRYGVFCGEQLGSPVDDEVTHFSFRKRPQGRRHQNVLDHQLDRLRGERVENSGRWPSVWKSHNGQLWPSAGSFALDWSHVNTLEGLERVLPGVHPLFGRPLQLRLRAHLGKADTRAYSHLEIIRMMLVDALSMGFDELCTLSKGAVELHAYIRDRADFVLPQPPLLLWMRELEQSLEALRLPVDSKQVIDEALLRKSGVTGLYAQVYGPSRPVRSWDGSHNWSLAQYESIERGVVGELKRALSGLRSSLARPEELLSNQLQSCQRVVLDTFWGEFSLFFMTSDRDFEHLDVIDLRGPGEWSIQFIEFGLNLVSGMKLKELLRQLQLDGKTLY